MNEDNRLAQSLYNLYSDLAYMEDIDKLNHIGIRYVNKRLKRLIEIASEEFYKDKFNKDE